MPEPAIPDATQRRRALAVDASFIVQAPAGSGKTELLTQRYLRLLAEVDHPEEICAITFTRKAAAEMRNRILAALEAAGGPRPAASHHRLTWQLARAALARDAACDWQLVRAPNRLRVQTFDSLNHALACQLPLLSELGAAPATTDHPDSLYRSAVRATLQRLEDPRLGDQLECLLLHLDNRQGQLEELLCTLLARRDQWLQHVAAAPDAQALDAALGRVIASHLAQLKQATDPDWLRRLIGMAQYAAANLGGSPAPTTGLASWVERTTAPGTAWPDLAAWQGLAQLLLTKGGGLRRQWRADIGFPAPSEKGLDGAAKARRQQAKATMQGLCAQLAEAPEALALWVDLPLLPGAGLDSRQQRVLGALFKVLLHSVAALQLVFQAEGDVDFAEIQLRAQRALGSPDDPTDLALSLDYRLRHLLVDEFQDTSSSQYHLLETLTAGWERGDGRTLFAVGDPMQSIYRFREAEVGKYLAARDRGIGQLQLTPLTLEVNFRSTRGIVDWVNASFRAVLPARQDIGRGAVPYAAAIAHDQSADPAAVQAHPFAGDPGPGEAATVVELVRAALAETVAGQVAILARARSHLAAIAGALKAAGLAFQAVDVDPLAEQPVIRDLHALTRALLHPADRLAWLVVLRAPWLGLAFDDLLRLAEGSERCLLARLRDPAVPQTLSDDGRRRIARLLQILDGQLPARGRRPLRQWVEAIWLRLGGLAVAGPAGMADAQAYLALLEAHEEAAGLKDFAALEAALARLYAAPGNQAGGRIQLMTMHKAKGLEFDTVILPGLGRKARASASALLNWQERTTADGTTELLMAPIRAADQPAEPIADYLRELNRDKDQLESARLLYVATTRARRRLHLLGHVDLTTSGLAERPPAGSLLERLWPAVEAHFATLQAPTAPPAGGGPVTLAPLRRLAADWRPAAHPDLAAPVAAAPDDSRSDPIEFAWAGDTARHVGTLVHRLLERIANEGIGHWPATRVTTLHGSVERGLRHLGVPADELEDAVAKTLRALRQTLADDTGRWILADHAEARCEWPLTLHQATTNHYVIDRSFVDQQGTRWIIDYKTGEHLAADREAFLDQEQARYRIQLETYGRILRLLEDRPIRLALYFPLFPAWRVWHYRD